MFQDFKSYPLSLPRLKCKISSPRH